ncbi:MAG: hypothetical protein ACI6PN_03170 [Polaribacter sp.]|uniref:hypothetical protein n=1 Tax=Polaribacter sp. TaxID=1920175 RepID=UPI00384ED83E
MQDVLTELEQLKITASAKGFLKEIASWCKFLSILGFIGLGLLLLGSFFIGVLYNSLPLVAAVPFNLGTMMTIFYLVVVLIYIFPIYYLYQFSVKMKKALLSKDDEVLASAFEMLKSHYKFIGVFTIITVSIYLLIAISAVMGVIGAV